MKKPETVSSQRGMCKDCACLDKYTRRCHRHAVRAHVSKDHPAHWPLVPMDGYCWEFIPKANLA